MPVGADERWHLRPIAACDIAGLHTLECETRVYRYLFDGAAPERSDVEQRVRQAIDHAQAGFGMWILTGRAASYAGCVALRPYPASQTAELTCLLTPELWGQGLATRMAWTVIGLAFRSPQIDAVFASADTPNEASFAVMRRLGMRFHKSVRYPLGAGVEYIRRRDDTMPVPQPTPLPVI